MRICVVVFGFIAVMLVGVKFGSAASRQSHSKVQSAHPLPVRQSRVHPRYVGEATLSQQLLDSHILKLSQPVGFQSGLSKLLDSHWTMAQYQLLTIRCTGTVGLAIFDSTSSLHGPVTEGVSREGGTAVVPFRSWWFGSD